MLAAHGPLVEKSTIRICKLTTLLCPPNVRIDKGGAPWLCQCCLKLLEADTSPLNAKLRAKLSRQLPTRLAPAVSAKLPLLSAREFFVFPAFFRGNFAFYIFNFELK
jgi:hypothetical protein